ncbi:hypothetical protein B0T24DRAFT_236461 [Lasiosphaeria ovina]|uniref:Uncharacterized protein n=1 Tax=Lasiosphaeria ovina TaxID=92902 RepID=A0AAE0KIM6_9PEZI|nr:hypothetical protein B0T24DRAFT_236461 [Lasiosphaeria ovina]
MRQSRQLSCSLIGGFSDSLWKTPRGPRTSMMANLARPGFKCLGSPERKDVVRPFISRPKTPAHPTFQSRGMSLRCRGLLERGRNFRAVMSGLFPRSRAFRHPQHLDSAVTPKTSVPPHHHPPDGLSGLHVPTFCSGNNPHHSSISIICVVLSSVVVRQRPVFRVRCGLRIRRPHCQTPHQSVVTCPAKNGAAGMLQARPKARLETLWSNSPMPATWKATTYINHRV